jgi:hypothetical protein
MLLLKIFLERGRKLIAPQIVAMVLKLFLLAASCVVASAMLLDYVVVVVVKNIP